MQAFRLDSINIWAESQDEVDEMRKHCHLNFREVEI